MDSAQFLSRLRFSEVLREDQIDGFLGKLPLEALDDPKELAGRFVKAGLLTRWQAKELLAGRDRLVIGKYRLLDRIGGGGMGDVFCGEHVMLQRRAAVKVISSRCAGDPQSVERFLREARVAAKLVHPNIVLTYDLDHDEELDAFYLAMALIDGKDLSRYTHDEERVPVERAVDLIRQVAEGLACAHRSGVVHRDIKPSNIMVDSEGRAIILDMGLARIHGDHGDQVASFVSTRGPLGTPQYMSPEQFVNAHDVDIRSDIYSLGCTLYFLLARQHPFPLNDFFQLQQAHRQEQPRPIRELRGDVPPSLVVILGRMMAKRPDDRFQEPAEVIDALNHWRTARRAAEPPPTIDQPPRDEDSFGGGETRTGMDWSGGAQVQAAPPEPRPAATEEPLPPGVVLHRVRDLAIEMVRVPAGPFQAGCSRAMAEQAIAGLAIRNPQDAVQTLMKNRFEERSVEAFEIGRFTVTNEQYGRFLEMTGHAPPPGWGPAMLSEANRRKPVVNVDLRDVREFCRWANVRLPTPDEWEKAARGADGRSFPWGDRFDEARCCCNEASAQETVPVDRYPAGDSPFGVRQAIGNVWEWVEPPGGQPAVRGGSFESSCQLYGPTFVSISAEPDVRRPNIGFRVVFSSHRPAPAAAPAVVRAVRQQVRKELEADCVEVGMGPFVRGLNEAMVAGLVREFDLSERDVQKLVGEGMKIVHLPTFSIAQRCVTNAQYLAFVRDSGRNPPESWERRIVDGAEPSAEWQRLPVTHVSQDDALAFCEWAGVHLPLNDEWEKAARGDRGQLYPWGDKFEAARCNSAESGRGVVIAVDSLPQGKSPYGLFHATGNVFEWTADRENDLATVRGGSFDYSCSVYGLLGYRMMAAPNLALESFGFRVARR